MFKYILSNSCMIFYDARPIYLYLFFLKLITYIDYFS
jgi:hypothetical protein